MLGGPQDLPNKYSTSGIPERKWLAAHPHFQLHFTPTGASWLNLVESWFSKLTQQRLRRGVFCSVQKLVAAIRDYLRHHSKVILGTHH